MDSKEKDVDKALLGLLLRPTMIWVSRLPGAPSWLGCDGTGNWRHRGWAERDQPLPQGPPGQLTVLQGW